MFRENVMRLAHQIKQVPSPWLINEFFLQMSFSFKLSIGKTAIAGCDLYTNEAIAGLVPKKNNQLLDAYLFQIFNAGLVDLSGTGFKASGKSLNSTFLKNEVQIPLPPLTAAQLFFCKSFQVIPWG